MSRGTGATGAAAPVAQTVWGQLVGPFCDKKGLAAC
jgi:hypothetical protein